MQTISARLTTAFGISLFLIASNTYAAQQGDDEAVAKARKDYELALESKDIGRINAMKIELSVQIAKSRTNIKQRQQTRKVISEP